MQYENRIELEIRGERALFSDPLISAGGEKLSCPIPTREALKGILSSVYWKPTIIWYPDELRVMNVIRYENIGVRQLRYAKSGCALSEWTVLRDVCYRLSAHFEWNENRPELCADRNEHRHYFGAKRMLERGGARPVFLGKRRFCAEVSPCRFSEGEGFYDHAQQDFGFMYCGITYPDEGYDDITRSGISVNYFRAEMRGGIIRYPRPEECESRFVKPMPVKSFGGEKSLELV